MNISDTINNINSENEKINQDLPKDFMSFKNKIHYFNLNPKETLDEIIKIEEFKNIILRLSKIKKFSLLSAAKCVLPISGVITILYTIISGFNLYMAYHNLLYALTIIMSAPQFFLMTTLFIAVIYFVLFKPKEKEITNVFNFYPIFMKPMFPDTYEIENNILNKSSFKIEKDLYDFYSFDLINVETLLTFHNITNNGYISSITLQNSYKVDNETKYKTVFKGFVCKIKFKKVQDYFDESGGFVIINKQKEIFSKQIKDYFNSDYLNEKLSIYFINDVEDDFKVKQFLTPETEELLKSIYNQFGQIGIKITNEEIILLLSHDQYGFIGDKYFDLNDFKYKNLYVEYEKIYILQILYKRLKRNMNSEIDLMKENQMNNWIYNENKNISNPEWDSWIKSLKNKGEKL